MRKKGSKGKSMLEQKGFAIVKNHFGNVSITLKNGRLDIFDDYNSAAHCLDDSDPIIDYKIEEVVILRVEGNKAEEATSEFDSPTVYQQKKPEGS